jgi:hypothetical protein
MIISSEVAVGVIIVVCVNFLAKVVFARLVFAETGKLGFKFCLLILESLDGCVEFLVGVGKKINNS